MIEAVNSVLSNASYTKAVVDQQSVAGSFAANPDLVQKASVQAPYISLYIKVDVTYDKALLQLRDSDTGDVVQQIPSESQLEAYRRAQRVVESQYQPSSQRTEEASVPQQQVEPAQPVQTRTTESSAAPAVNTASAATIAPAVTQSAPTPVDTSV